MLGQMGEKMRKDGGGGRCNVNGTLLPLKVFNFLYYGAVGAALPFLSAYLHHLRLSAPEVGLVAGVAVLASAVVRPLVGVLADHVTCHRALLALCCVGFGTGFCCLWFVPRRNPLLQSPCLGCRGGPNDTRCPPDFFNTHRHVLCVLHAPGPPDVRGDNSSAVLETNGTLRDGEILLTATTGSRPHLTEGAGSAEVVTIVIHPPDERLGSDYREDITPLTLSLAVQGGLLWGEVTMLTCSLIGPPGDTRNLSGEGLPKSQAELLVRSAAKMDVASSEGWANATPEDAGWVDQQKGQGGRDGRKMTARDRCRFTCQPTCHPPCVAAQPAYAADHVLLTSVLLASVARAFYSSSSSLSDSVTYGLLGADRHLWGRQRLWGSLGTALTALAFMALGHRIAGDGFSTLFATCACLTVLACLAICLLPVLAGDDADRHSSKSHSTGWCGGEVGRALLEVGRVGAVRLLLVKLLLLGWLCGAAHTFIFFFLRSLGAGPGVLGGCLLANCLSGVAALAASPTLVRRLGETRAMYLALPAYAVRFVSLSLVETPWVGVLAECLHGLTYSLLWATASALVQRLATPSARASCQAIAGAVYWDAGRGLGSVVTGQLFRALGPRLTFQVYGGVAAALLPLGLLLDRRWPIAHTAPAPQEGSHPHDGTGEGERLRQPPPPGSDSEAAADAYNIVTSVSAAPSDGPCTDTIYITPVSATPSDSLCNDSIDVMSVSAKPRDCSCTDSIASV